jgi:hypothetical protein
MNIRRLSSVLLFTLMLGLLISSPSFAAEKVRAGARAKRAELKMAFRDLWVGHIFWVRNVVLMTKFGDAGAAKIAEDQVVQNARDIANALVPFYGKEAGDKLFGLLAGHYGAVKEYMTAAFSGKKAPMDNMMKNVGDIATFLSSANPNWKKDDLVSALTAHGGFHMAQIDAINGKDFASEAKTWNGMEKQIIGVADYLTDGLVKQFPKKF